MRERLRRVEEMLRRFVLRDVLALLELSPEWKGKPLSVDSILLASNQVRLALRHVDHSATPLRLIIAEHGGELIGSVEDAGWLDRLSPPEARTLDQTIAGMYKLAGVDWVRKPAAEVPVEPPHSVPLAAVQVNGVVGVDGQATISLRGVAYTWPEWVEWWRRDRSGETPAPPVWVLPGAPH